MRKNKDRLNKKYKNVETLEFNFDYVPEEKEEVEEENVSAIVKRKNISMKPMDEEEAVLQIELLNHDFFVFKNIDEECVSVIYKRKDGNYGIINMK
jgi:putative sigma-54 modulation protein